MGKSAEYKPAAYGVRRIDSFILPRAKRRRLFGARKP